MRKKVINAALCDARNVTEESLSCYDSVRIKTAMLIVSERSKELLNKYNVDINTAGTIEIPDDRDIQFKHINGKGEIGPNSDGTDTFLLVNGKIIVESGSREALQSYYKIIINGKALMPESLKGQLSNIQVNGKIEYYPDGATILKSDTVIDDLFIARATNDIYYCQGKLFFIDDEIDTEKILAKKIKFFANKILVAESLLMKIITAFDEKTDIVKIADGCRLIKEDVEINAKLIKKYGSRLCVCGDASISDEEALSSLEYLFVDGTVSINKSLEEAFYDLNAVYEDLNIIDPDIGLINDQASVKVGAMFVGKYPGGVVIKDCAKVTIDEGLDPEIIMKKIRIIDCALVVCTKEQEEAVSYIAEDIAKIRVIGADMSGDDESKDYEMQDSVLGEDKDAIVVNAAEYKM